MENKVKGIDDVRFNGQADPYHCNGCKYNRERGKFSKDRKEKKTSKNNRLSAKLSVAD